MTRRQLLRRPGSSGRISHVAALDGVRGLAVAVVVIYHLDADLLPGGFLGVSLFFTLSGFLITNLLLAEWGETGTVDLGTFWRRRFRRLLPASLGGVALVLVLSPAWTAGQLASLPGDVAGAVGYVTNWRFIAAGDRYGAGFEAPSPLLHYWSLAIEEQFYLVVAAATVVLAAGRSRRRWVVVFAAIGVVSVVATLALYDPLQTDRVYFGSLTRAAELIAGVLLALAVGLRIPNRWQRAAGLGGGIGLIGLLIAVSTVDLATDGLYRGGFWLTAAGSVLLIGGALVDGPVQRLLRWGPLASLGLVSYGIYVYHWPLLVWLDETRTGLDGLGLAAVRLAATAAVTLASFIWLERPIREGRFDGRVLIGVGAALSAALAGGAWLLAQDAAGRAVAGEAPTIVLADAPAATTQPPIIDDGAAVPSTTVSSTTVPSSTTTTSVPPLEPLRTVVILGDSLVHQAYPTIEDRFARVGITTHLYGGAGETLMTDQAAWLADLDAAVRDHDPDLVILESCCGTGDPRRPDPYLAADGLELEPDSAEIWAEWERLAHEYTAAARERGAQVLWILAPPADTNGYYGPIEGRIEIANAIYRDVAECSSHVALLDWGLLAGTDGGYVDALPDADGDLITVRADDGLHFTEAGQALLADLTRTVAQRSWTGRNVDLAEPCGG